MQRSRTHSLIHFRIHALAYCIVHHAPLATRLDCSELCFYTTHSAPEAPGRVPRTNVGIEVIAVGRRPIGLKSELRLRANEKFCKRVAESAKKIAKSLERDPNC